MRPYNTIFKSNCSVAHLQGVHACPLFLRVSSGSQICGAFGLQIWAVTYVKKCKYEIVALSVQIARIEADLREIRVAEVRTAIRERRMVSASSATFWSNPLVRKTKSAR